MLVCLDPKFIKAEKIQVWKIYWYMAYSKISKLNNNYHYLNRNTNCLNEILKKVLRYNANETLTIKALFSN